VARLAIAKHISGKGDVETDGFRDFPKAFIFRIPPVIVFQFDNDGPGLQ
jgi:hypothetical protein